MNCPNCFAFNSEGAKYCVKCGSVINNNLQNNTQPQINQSNVIQPQNNNEVYSQVNPVNNNQTSYQSNATMAVNYNTNSASKISIGDYFIFILSFILKPFTAWKEESDKFGEFKNSMILSLIVSVTTTIITVVKTVLSVVRVKEYGIFEDDKMVWEWDRIEYIDFIDVIVKNLVLYLGIIFLIAGIYYLGSLIIKKHPKFPKLLASSALSIMPLLISSLLLSPILSMIYAPLGILISVAGIIYTLVMIYEMMSQEIKLEENMKLYFNLVCLLIFIVAAFYLYVKFFLGIDLSNIGSAFELLSY